MSISCQCVEKTNLQTRGHVFLLSQSEVALFLILILASGIGDPGTSAQMTRQSNSVSAEGLRFEKIVNSGSWRGVPPRRGTEIVIMIVSVGTNAA
jgi:hypothetical protein